MSLKCKMCGKEMSISGDIGPECLKKIKKRIISNELQTSGVSDVKEVNPVSDSVFKDILSKKEIAEQKPQLMKEEREPELDKNGEAHFYQTPPLTMDLMLSIYDEQEFSYYDGKKIFDTMKNSTNTLNEVLSKYKYEGMFTPFHSDEENKYLGMMMLSFPSSLRNGNKNFDATEMIGIPLYSNEEDIYFRDFNNFMYDDHFKKWLLVKTAMSESTYSVYEHDRLSEGDINVVISKKRDNLQLSSANTVLCDPSGKLPMKDLRRYDIDPVGSLRILPDLLKSRDNKVSYGLRRFLEAKFPSTPSGELVEKLDPIKKNSPVMNKDPGQLKVYLAEQIKERVKEGQALGAILSYFEHPVYKAAFHRQEFYELVMTYLKIEGKIEE